MVKGPVNVLVIEDNPGHLDLMRRCLSRSGIQHSFQSATSLAEALALLHKTQFDVILSDLSLPDSSGLATIDCIREQSPAVPVVVVTSLDDEDVAVAALDRGAQDYVVKDVAGLSWARVRQVIHFAVQRQLMMNEKQGLLSQVQEATRQLERKNRRLSRLYRMAQEFVDHASHEFRTPLSIIKEYASLLRDGVVGQVNSDQSRLLNVIDDRSDDLNTMVDDLLDVSKLKSGLLAAWRRPCAVDEIIQHVLPALERKAITRKVVLETDIAADLPVVYCDAEKAGRVLVNLVVNAIKFAKEPGHVRLWVRAQPDKCEVVVRVTDNGIGISERDLEKIFKRFSQLNNKVQASTKGFGLGLSIAKELTTLNLGSMSVESQPGVGSTFQFTLPCAIPCEVVSRYLERMSGTSGDKSPVTIVTATVPDDTAESLALDVDRFLNYLLRRHDLLFRIETGRWLLVLGTPAIELEKFSRRVERLRAEANHNRPRSPLPEIAFQADGTWSPEAGREEILSLVQQTCRSEVVC
jgi:signal transduction histidine kinase